MGPTSAFVLGMCSTLNHKIWSLFFFLISFFNKVSLLSALIESVFYICCEPAIEMIELMVFDFLYFHPDEKLSCSGVRDAFFLFSCSVHF